MCCGSHPFLLITYIANSHTLFPYSLCRYLSARARLPVAPAALPLSFIGTAAAAPGTERAAAAQAIMPSSLAQSVLFSTPIGQKSMRLGARARGCEEGTVYSTGKVRERSWAGECEETGGTQGGSVL